MRNAILALAALALFLINFNACSCDNEKEIKEIREKQEIEKLTPTEIAKLLKKTTVLSTENLWRMTPFWMMKRLGVVPGFLLQRIRIVITS